MAAVTVIPANPPAPRATRPRVLLVGTCLAIAACFMLFAGLIGIYLSTRAGVIHHGGTWLPKGAAIPLTPATMTLFTFLLSAVTMRWSVWAVTNNDRQHALLALAVTMLFGICTINATSFLYSQTHLGVGSSATGALFYVITGAHLAMIVAALVFAGLMTFRTLGGEYSGRDREGIVAASLFWYATIAVYAVIWYAVYVTK